MAVESAVWDGYLKWWEWGNNRGWGGGGMVLCGSVWRDRVVLLEVVERCLDDGMA